MKFPILEKLLALKQEKRIPFHMPGHKRKSMDCFSDISSMDITEITDYDNLHHPQGIIAESMEMLKNVYHTKKSWYLINGSTVGILSAISALCHPGDSILVARNCHKAVYNAIRLLRLYPIYFYPNYSDSFDMMQGITEEDGEEIQEIIQKNPHIKAMIITSPTYEGIVSDVQAIKKILQQYDIPLIVDEAHGAHFIFHEYFPKSAVECGADIVIQSAHKTLPSFTQTALLHLCTDNINTDKIEEMLSIYETSSPSYLLLASTEYGVLYTQNHPDKVQEYVDNLIRFRRKCAQLKWIHLLEKDEVQGFDYDRGKLVFVVKDTPMGGKELFQRMLERYHIEFEMETAFYCIAMTSLMDEKEDYDRLLEALKHIDQEMDREINGEKRRKIDSQKSSPIGSKIDSQTVSKAGPKIVEKTENRPEESVKEKDAVSLFSAKPERIVWVWEALEEEEEEITLEESAGRIAKEYIYLYPPGIPLLVPGEKIEKEVVENIRYYLYNGYNIPALSNHRIRVLKEILMEGEHQWENNP